MLRRDQRGVALPSPVVLLSAAAVALAAVAFVVTGHHDDDKVELTTQPSAPTVSAPATPKKGDAGKARSKPAKKAPKIDRSKVKVLVYNDTNVSGLASTVGTQVSKAGWHFVAADNWAGTIPATTVYYPAGMKDAAHQLALDLGIKRIYPRDPDATGMLPDGLTVILLGPLS